LFNSLPLLVIPLTVIDAKTMVKDSQWQTSCHLLDLK
jgi:hypothetical protein